MTKEERVRYILSHTNPDLKPDFHALATQAKVEGFYGPNTNVCDIECSFDRAWRKRSRIALERAEPALP